MIMEGLRRSVYLSHADNAKVKIMIYSPMFVFGSENDDSYSFEFNHNSFSNIISSKRMMQYYSIIAHFTEIILSDRTFTFSAKQKTRHLYLYIRAERVYQFS